jgi:hypothetical protein
MMILTILKKALSLVNDVTNKRLAQSDDAAEETDSANVQERRVSEKEEREENQNEVDPEAKIILFLRKKLI